MAKRGGRRTVIQIDNDVAKQSTFGFGYKAEGSANSQALGGLIAQYGASDDNDSNEEEEEQLPQKVAMQAFIAASEPELPPQHYYEVPQLNEDGKPKSILKSGKKEQPKSILKGKKEQVVVPPPPPPREPALSNEADKNKTRNSEVDEKLKDFLAEIDALENLPLNGNASTEKVANVNATNGDAEDIDGLPMTPPTLEGIGQSAEEEWVEITDNEQEQEPAPTKPIEPVALWQHCLDEETQYYYYWHQETNEVTWEIPESYSQYLLQMKEYEDLVKKFDKDMKDWEDRHKNRPKKTKRILRKKPVILTVQPPPPPPPEEKPPPEQTHTLPTPQPQPQPPMQQKTTPDKLKKGEECFKKSKEKKESKRKSKKSHKASSVERDSGPPIVHGPSLPLIGPQFPPPMSGEDPNDVSTENDLKENINCEHQPNAVKHKMEEEDDDFIHQQLEEPVFSHYEFVNKKYQPTAPRIGPDNIRKSKGKVSYEMDLDDIDRELEMALEKKKVAGVESEDLRVQQAPGKKRGSSGLAVKPPTTKRLKTEPVIEQSEEGLLSRLSRTDIQMKVDALAESSELANLVMNKLDFLEVHRKGLSDLQVLLIQLETRIEDWKKGGLNTDYLLVKLRQADSELQKYEENASPPGWSCHWDRSYKKYFYFNDVTGESQWDYPLDEYNQSEMIDEVHPTSKDQTEEMDLQTMPVESKTLEENTADISEQAGDAQPSETQDNQLDFTKLAQAPPPPPGEPPPPGTEDTLPDSALELEPSHSNIVGHDQPDSSTSDSSRDSGSSSDEEDRRHYNRSKSESSSRSRSRSRSSDSNRSHSQSDSHTDDDISSRKSNESSKQLPGDGDYDPTDPTELLDFDGDKEEEVEAGVELPVHKKPVHIAAQPVLNKLPPSTEECKSLKPESLYVKDNDNTATCLPSENLEESNSDLNKLTSNEYTDSSNLENINETEISKSYHHHGKKKKKEKTYSGGGLSMKKKGMSSMVEKWRKVQKDVEKEKKSKKRPPKYLEDGEIE